MAQWFGVLWGKSTDSSLPLVCWCCWAWLGRVQVKTEPKQHAEVDVGPPGASAGLEGVVCGWDPSAGGVGEDLGLVAAGLSPKLLWKCLWATGWRSGRLLQAPCSGWHQLDACRGREWWYPFVPVLLLHLPFGGGRESCLVPCVPYAAPRLQQVNHGLLGREQHKGLSDWDKHYKNGWSNILIFIYLFIYCILRKLEQPFRLCALTRKAVHLFNTFLHFWSCYHCKASAALPPLGSRAAACISSSGSACPYLVAACLETLWASLEKLHSFDSGRVSSTSDSQAKR